MEKKMDDVKIFASVIDDVTKAQVAELAASDAYNGCAIRVMPDCHAGTGCTIGTVIAFRDRVVPNTVGVDIGCGMLVIELGKVDIDLAKLDAVIREKVPSGLTIHKTPQSTYPFLDSLICRDMIDKDYALCSIGTLGGGNHFIEVDEDDEGNKYLVIHSGSRNLGVRVCKYWQERAISSLTDDSDIRKKIIAQMKAEGREREIGEALKSLGHRKINKDLAYLDSKSVDFYLSDMMICQEYAFLNRNTIADVLCSSLRLKVMSYFTTIHNYIDIPHKIIRKGAIAAPKGRKVIIPMNMRDGSLICVGKGNKDWLDSAPHGAGRIMSRAQAKANLSLAQYEAEMSSVYTTSVCKETIDESPMAYKPIDVIMNDIKDAVDIVKAIRPIYNFKAKE